MFVKIACLCIVLLSSVALSEVVEYTFDVREWVVDFKRPTVELKSPAERKNPFQVPAVARKGAILINGQYPAPVRIFFYIMNLYSHHFDGLGNFIYVMAQTTARGSVS